MLDIKFSGAVSGAGDLAAYELSSITTKTVKKKHVTTLKRIKLSSVLPASSPTTTAVNLVLAAKPNLGQTDELQITAADLTDSLGRALDGNDDGQPGGNFIGTITKSGFSLGQPSPCQVGQAVGRGSRRRAAAGPIALTGQRGMRWRASSLHSTRIRPRGGSGHDLRQRLLPITDPQKHARHAPLVVAAEGESGIGEWQDKLVGRNRLHHQWPGPGGHLEKQMAFGVADHGRFRVLVASHGIFPGQRIEHFGR